ncbi:leucine-rich repeat-containing protein 16A isoform 1 [Cricetulus griseus]|nr:leucine-rich repeat-containing protein 16A isoform 1 [Cricetulus griseus]
MTDESSDVPRELTESIKDVIGRKIKISVKKKVKLEVKGDRVENKVLVSIAQSVFNSEKSSCLSLLNTEITGYTS